MTAGWFGKRLAIFGAALILGAPLAASDADAARAKSRNAATTNVRTSAHANARTIQAGMTAARGRHAGWGRSVARYGRVGGGLQCVPFARENSGIELSGNAATWWSGAEGVYERGARPEVGSVLNFRANGRMRMGHVAVVANVINGRNIEIDHANWSGPGAGRGNVSRNINVVDVSERNDWSAVRVALGQSDTFGSIYPTYGFIYDRPDRGTMLANAGRSPSQLLNAAPRDLRPAADRYATNTVAQEAEEVAEADDDAPVRSRRLSTRHARAHHKASAIRVNGRPIQTISRQTISHQTRRHRL